MTAFRSSNPSPLACGAVDKLVKSPVFQAGFLRVRFPSALLLPYSSTVERCAVNAKVVGSSPVGAVRRGRYWQGNLFAKQS